MGRKLKQPVDMRSVYHCLARKFQDPTPAIQALRSQVKIVYYEAGMTPAEETYKYSLSSPNAGITDYNVAVQAAEFVSKRNALKARAGDQYHFLRYTRPELLSELDAAPFPDVHYCTAKTNEKSTKKKSAARYSYDLYTAKITNIQRVFVLPRKMGTTIFEA